jgi:hypothetical protein
LKLGIIARRVVLSFPKLSLIIFCTCLIWSIYSLGSIHLPANAELIGQKYENKDLGIKVLFPEGWKTGTTTTSLENDGAISFTLNKISAFSELAASDFSRITLSAGKNLSLLNDGMKANSFYDDCVTDEKSTVRISGKQFESSVVHCPTIRYKVYHFHGPSLTVNYSYAALPSSFAADLADFEASVKSVTIK